MTARTNTGHCHPAVVKAMAERHLMYNRQMEEIEERERDGRAFVIRPPAMDAPPA